MQRPASVTTFGILNIVFAAFGAFGVFASMALFSLPASSGNPVIAIIHENPAYATWLKINIALGLVACAALLAAGIGLLKLKEWGRKLSLGYGIYAIVVGIAGMIANYFFLLRPMMEKAQQMQGPEAAGAVGGAIGGSLGGCVGLIYPILLLIFMTRPKVVAAFRSPTSPPELPVV